MFAADSVSKLLPPPPPSHTLSDLSLLWELSLCQVCCPHPPPQFLFSPFRPWSSLVPIQSLVGPPNPFRHDSSLVLTVCQFCWQAKANLPKPPSDLKNKIKSTPSATMGLSFELADLQGQNNQSENYPSPGKGYQAGKPSETIGAIPDKASPLLGICPFLFSGKDHLPFPVLRKGQDIDWPQLP